MEESNAEKSIEDIIIDSYIPFIEDTSKEISKTKFLNPTIEQINSLSKKAFSVYSEFGKDPFVEVSSPVIIVGDIHGNMKDLLLIFRQFGTPATKNYLFIGDYVDRGVYSIPVISILLAFKIKYSENVTLLRGNHEISYINAEYGFLADLKKGYGNIVGCGVWRDMNAIFSYFPLCCVINKSIFCVHGGLSPLLKSINDLKCVTLPIDDIDECSPIVADMLWSDPSDTNGFKKNNRGSGFLFGYDTVNDFLTNNKLKLLVRGHQVTSTGVSLFASNLGITVFSSSGYNRILENKCGVLCMESKTEFTLHSFSLKGDDIIDYTNSMRTVPKRLGLSRVFVQNDLVPHKVVPKKV